MVRLLRKNSGTVVIPKPGHGTKNQRQIAVDIVPENSDIHDQAQVYRMEMSACLKGLEIEWGPFLGLTTRSYHGACYQFG